MTIPVINVGPLLLLIGGRHPEQRVCCHTMYPYYVINHEPKMTTPTSFHYMDKAPYRAIAAPIDMPHDNLRRFEADLLERLVTVDKTDVHLFQPVLNDGAVPTFVHCHGLTSGPLSGDL